MIENESIPKAIHYKCKNIRFLFIYIVINYIKLSSTKWNFKIIFGTLNIKIKYLYYNDRYPLINVSNPRY